MTVQRAQSTPIPVGRTRLVTAAAVACVALAALALRLDGIWQPPLDFHPSRQYHSALLARAYFVSGDESVSAARREVADRNKDEEEIIEPPILEAVSATVWRLIGSEQLWVPRVLSVAFWLAGGVFLFLIARRLASEATAFFSLLVYLFLPYGVFASRSFQPDPLMLMLLLAALLAVLRYDARPSTRNLLTAAGVAGAAGLVKPGIALLPIYGAFAGLWVRRTGFGRRLADARIALFVALAAVPAAVYYLYGTVVESFLEGQAGAKAAPSELLDAYFWSGWLDMISRVLGYVPGLAPPVAAVLLAGAFYGAVTGFDGRGRAFLGGAFAGYLAFGLVFTEHIHTHDYYSLALIPLVALGLGPPLARLTAGVARIRVAAPVVAMLGIGLVAVVGAAAWVAHGRLNDDHASEVSQAEDVGEAVRHSPSTLLLASHSGNTLRYHGWLAGTYWPSNSALDQEQRFGLRRISVSERFATRDADYHPAVASIDPPPRYFIVTDLDELAAQPELESFLRSRFPVSARGDGYVVYRLRGD